MSGEIGNQAIQTDNSFHVVLFEGSSTNTVLDGFTITKGNANFDPKINSSEVGITTVTVETGGGIAIKNAGTPMIANCTLMNNWGIFGGGIFVSDASNPTISACKLMGNQATFGSGIYLLGNSNALVKNTLITGNRGIGGIYCTQSSHGILRIGGVNCCLR